MKKVLFVHYSLQMGGIERALISLLQRLPKDRYQIDLLFFDTSGVLMEQIPEGIRILEPLEMLAEGTPRRREEWRSQGKTKLADLWESIARENKKLAEQGVQKGEIIQNKWEHLRNLCPALPGYDISIAYSDVLALRVVMEKTDAKEKIVWIHSNYNGIVYNSARQIQYLEQANTLVCVGEQIKQHMHETYPALRPLLRVIHNILPTEDIIASAEAFFPVEFQPGIKHLLSIGRLCYDKGVDLMLDAAALLYARRQDFVWHIIGGAQSNQLDYIKMKKDKGVGSYVDFMGEKTNPYPFLAQCMLYIQPSRFEGQSVTLEEAKLLGKPILVTRYPFVTDSIIHLETGYICGFAPEEIAQAIDRLLADDTLRNQLAQRAGQEKAQSPDALAPYLQLLG